MGLPADGAASGWDYEWAGLRTDGAGSGRGCERTGLDERIIVWQPHGDI